MTDAGLQAMRVSQSMRLIGKTLRRRDVEYDEASVFELLSYLHERGWVCNVFVRQKSHKHPEPCAAGQKVYWAKPNQQRWSASYLLALLTMETHGQAVEHFKPDGFYDCLMQGKPYVARRSRKAGSGFAFAAETDCKAGPDGEHDQGSDSKSDSDSESATSSSSGASHSSSSKQSSSTSSSSADDEQVENIGPHVDAEAPATNSLVPVAEVPLLMPGARQYWKGFKFCQTYGPEGEAHGWEVTCYHGCHKGATSCRRRRLFSKHGGPVGVERALKDWCLRAAAFPNRVAHRDDPDLDISQVPTLRQLEEAPCPALDGRTTDEPLAKKAKAK
jgi:hypothetical protein